MLNKEKEQRQGGGGGGGGGGGERKSFIKGYAIKADVRHYFETVDQAILFTLIQKRIKDEPLLHLIKQILTNFDARIPGKGMPLGNLTSQFFANIYLNELDQFVKHQLKVNYYLRYVDDFVIIHRDKTQLEKYKLEINTFLLEKLKITLHPEKSKIIPLSRGIPLLGFRVFYYHKQLRKGAVRRITARLNEWKVLSDLGLMEQEKALERLLGWMAYAVQGNTYYLRKKIMAKFSNDFPTKDQEDN